MAMDEVDYFLHGDDMQFVEIELDPGEAAVAEAGAMMFKEGLIDGMKHPLGYIAGILRDSSNDFRYEKSDRKVLISAIESDKWLAIAASRPQPEALDDLRGLGQRT